MRCVTQPGAIRYFSLEAQEKGHVFELWISCQNPSFHRMDPERTKPTVSPRYGGSGSQAGSDQRGGVPRRSPFKKGSFSLCAGSLLGSGWSAQTPAPCSARGPPTSILRLLQPMTRAQVSLFSRVQGLCPQSSGFLSSWYPQCLNNLSLVPPKLEDMPRAPFTK